MPDLYFTSVIYFLYFLYLQECVYGVRNNIQHFSFFKPSLKLLKNFFNFSKNFFKTFEKHFRKFLKTFLRLLKTEILKRFKLFF